MPYNEEVPADYKPRCGCKRRECPMQDYFEDKTKKKRFFKYQCRDPKTWAICLRWVNPVKCQGENQQFSAPFTAEPAKPTAEDKRFKCPHEGCIFRAKTEAEISAHVERIHPPAPAPQPEPTPEPQPPQPQQELAKPTAKKPAPTKQQLDHRCKEYPHGCNLCSIHQQQKCGVRSQTA